MDQSLDVGRGLWEGLVWLFVLALLPTTGGVLIGMSGLAGWSLHCAWLARLLS